MFQANKEPSKKARPFATYILFDLLAPFFSSKSSNVLQFSFFASTSQQNQIQVWLARRLDKQPSIFQQILVCSILPSFQRKISAVWGNTIVYGT